MAAEITLENSIRLPFSLTCVLFLACNMEAHTDQSPQHFHVRTEANTPLRRQHSDSSAYPRRDSYLGDEASILQPQQSENYRFFISPQAPDYDDQFEKRARESFSLWPVPDRLLQFQPISMAQMSHNVILPEDIEHTLRKVFWIIKDDNTNCHPESHTPTVNFFKNSFWSVVFTIDECPGFVFKAMNPRFHGAAQNIVTRRRFHAARYVAGVCQIRGFNQIVVPKANLIELNSEAGEWDIIAEQKHHFISDHWAQMELFWRNTEAANQAILQLGELIATTGLADTEPKNVSFLSAQDRLAHFNHDVLSDKIVLMDLELFSTSDENMGLTGNGYADGLFQMVPPNVLNALQRRISEQFSLPQDDTYEMQQEREAVARHQWSAWHKAKGLEDDWFRPVQLPSAQAYAPEFDGDLSVQIASHIIGQVNAEIERRRQTSINARSAREVWVWLEVSETGELYLGSLPRNPSTGHHSASMDEVMRVLDGLKRCGLVFSYDLFTACGRMLRVRV